MEVVREGANPAVVAHPKWDAMVRQRLRQSAFNQGLGKHSLRPGKRLEMLDQPRGTLGLWSAALVLDLKFGRRQLLQVRRARGLKLLDAEPAFALSVALSLSRELNPVRVAVFSGWRSSHYHDPKIGIRLGGLLAGQNVWCSRVDRRKDRSYTYTTNSRHP